VRHLGNFRTRQVLFLHAQRNPCHDALGFRASTSGRGSLLLGPRARATRLFWQVSNKPRMSLRERTRPGLGIIEPFNIAKLPDLLRKGTLCSVSHRPARK
jgi:hypothetical protein